MTAGVHVEGKPGGYAVLTLCREPVNSLSLVLWQELAQAVDELERDPAVRGVILCSGLKRDVFTAGNDINELYAPRTSRQRYTDFWVTQNVFLARLYRSPLATVAAIRGACPAGGCCISLCCDHRVMTDFGSIGLNEVALGISVPQMWAGLMARTVGNGPAEKLLLHARLVKPAEALRLGLVDEVVPAAELMVAAEAAMQALLKMPDGGRTATKHNLRREYSLAWEAFPQQEAVGAWDMLESPAVVEALGATLKRLSGKAKL